MKKQHWLLLFGVALIANISAGLLKNQVLDYLSKPLIVFSLVGYFLIQTKNVGSSLRKWMIVALFFSWAGDVLLLFQGNGPMFFLLGLVCFLLTHIIYGLNFSAVAKKEKIRRNLFFTVLPVLFGIFFAKFLAPHLGNMKWPVFIYTGVIIAMLAAAIPLVYIKNKTAGYFIAAGALFFVASDSVLALNKFYRPFEIAGMIIMLTYGLAQLFIVEGAGRYISFDPKE